MYRRAKTLEIALCGLVLMVVMGFGFHAVDTYNNNPSTDYLSVDILQQAHSQQQADLFDTNVIICKPEATGFGVYYELGYSVTNNSTLVADLDLTLLLKDTTGNIVSIEDDYIFDIQPGQTIYEDTLLGDTRASGHTCEVIIKSVDFADLDDTGVDVSVLLTTITNLENSVTDIMTTLTSHTDSIESISTRVSTLETDTTTGTGSELNTTLEPRITALETKTDTIETKTDTIETKLSTIETNITTLSDKISGIETNIQTLTDKIEDIATTIPTQSDPDTTLEPRITALETKTDTIETKTTAIQTDITGLTGMLANIETSIQTLAGRIEEVAAGIVAQPDPDPEPVITTGISGKVYTDSNNNDTLDAGESGVSGRSVIAVNLTDQTDVSRDTTDANGDYSFELDAGGYLVQVEGTDAYAYVTILDGSVLTQNLGL